MTKEERAAFAGVIEKKEPFGYFVNLAPGITGLMPKSKFNMAEKPGNLERLKTGAQISVNVAEINVRDRKITLAPGDAADEEGWKDYAGGTQKETLSDLGQKLQAVLKSKGEKTK